MLFGRRSVLLVLDLLVFGFFFLFVFSVWSLFRSYPVSVFFPCCLVLFLLSGAFERLASVSVARFLLASTHLLSSVLYFFLYLIFRLVLLSSVFVPVGALRLLVSASSFCLLCRVLM